jgi:hypothetical protein
MNLKNLIMFFGYIKLIVSYYVGLIIQKLGIERKNEKFIESKNALMLKEYYNEYYNTECSLDEKYLGRYYNGYEVRDGDNLVVKENINIEEKRNFNLINYKFGLPIHEEVLNKLEIKVDRNKYKFIYVSLIKENYDLCSYDGFGCYTFLNEFFEEVNFIFIYETLFRENEEKLNVSYEFLLNVNSENMIKIINALDNIKIFKEYKYVIKEVNNEIEFFKGNYLLEQLKDSSIYLYIDHMHHDFLVYSLDEELEDYYILGNHINSFNIMQVLNFAYSINMDIYGRQNYSSKEIDKINELNLDDQRKLENKIEYKIKRNKDKIYKNIKNKYLKETYNNYILLNTNLISKYKYNIKFFLNKMKKFKISNIVYSMGMFTNIEKFKLFNNEFLKHNNDIKKLLNYDEIRIKNQIFLKKNEYLIKKIEVDLEQGKKLYFEHGNFNWEAIKFIRNNKDMLNNMNKCNKKDEETFDKFIIENPIINNTLAYGEEYKINNFNNINESFVFKEYKIEIWDKKKLLNEIDFNLERIQDINIEKALKHLVLSIKNNDKIIIYPLTHSDYLYININILKRQISEDNSLMINTELLNKLEEEIKQIKNIKIKNVELFEYKHGIGSREKIEIQYRTGRGFECMKKNEVLIPEKQNVLIPEKQEVLIPNYKNIIERYNENYECLTTSHNFYKNINNIKENTIYDMYNEQSDFIFNSENNGLRKFSEIFNYLKDYFII